MASDLRTVERNLRKSGFEFGEASRSGHRGIFWKGQRIGTWSDSPSDWRGLKNTLSQLARRSGMIIDGKGRIIASEVEVKDVKSVMTPEQAEVALEVLANGIEKHLAPTTVSTDIEREAMNEEAREEVPMLKAEGLRGRSTDAEVRARRELMVAWFEEHPDVSLPTEELYAALQSAFGYDVTPARLRQDLITLEEQGVIQNVGNSARKKWQYRVTTDDMPQRVPQVPEGDITVSYDPGYEMRPVSDRENMLTAAALSMGELQREVMLLRFLAKMKGATEEELDWVRRESQN